MHLTPYLKTAAYTSVLALSLLAAPLTQAATDFQQVINVASDDVLNMRASADASSAIIGTIPYNGRTIVATGNRSGNWVEVNWAGQTGWVNQRYLQPSDWSNTNSVSTDDRARPQRPSTDDRARPQRPNPTPNPSAVSVLHTHPANECTNSVSHSHPGGGTAHTHNYACQPGQNTSGVKPKFAPKYRDMQVQMTY